MLSAANLALAVEGLLAGVKAGVDPGALVELLRRGTGNSDALSTKVVGHVLPRTFDWGGSLEVIAKDMTAWREMADGLDLQCPLSRKVHETYMAAIGQLGKQADMTDIARYLEGIERVTIPATKTSRKPDQRTASASKRRRACSINSRLLSAQFPSACTGASRERPRSVSS